VTAAFAYTKCVFCSTQVAMPEAGDIPSAAGLWGNHMFTQVNEAVLLQFSMCETCGNKHGESYPVAPHPTDHLFSRPSSGPGERNLSVTLTDLKKIIRGKSEWQHLLAALGETRASKKPIPFERIVEKLSVEDALPAFMLFEGSDNAVRLFACRLARKVLHLFERDNSHDNRPRKAIEVAERFIQGHAKVRELDAAHSDAMQAGDQAFISIGGGIIATNIRLAAHVAAGAAFFNSRGGVQKGILLAYKEWKGGAGLWNVREELLRLSQLEGEYGKIS
jgi:hypothetical protein